MARIEEKFCLSEGLANPADTLRRGIRSAGQWDTEIVEELNPGTFR